jgi:hypothetical protein
MARKKQKLTGHGLPRPAQANGIPVPHPDEQEFSHWVKLRPKTAGRKKSRRRSRLKKSKVMTTVNKSPVPSPGLPKGCCQTTSERAESTWLYKSSGSLLLLQPLNVDGNCEDGAEDGSLRMERSKPAAGGRKAPENTRQFFLNAVVTLEPRRQPVRSNSE